MRFAERAEPFRDAEGQINWGTYSSAQGVEGFMHFQELSELVKLADGKDVLEVGSFRGLSAWCMAHVAKSIVCVDTFKANTAGQVQWQNYTTLEEFDRNLAEFDNVTRIPMTSESANNALTADASYDFIFLDAMHTYESVKEDIARWWRRLNPGGALALHDYAHDHFPGVQQAVDDVFGPETEQRVVTLRVIRKAL